VALLRNARICVAVFAYTTQMCGVVVSWRSVGVRMERPVLFSGRLPRRSERKALRGWQIRRVVGVRGVLERMRRSRKVAGDVGGVAIKVGIMDE
jgi:hypothetical protein